MLPDHVAYGTAIQQLPGTRLGRKDDDLDTLALVWQTDSENSFSTGAAPPDYPTFRIKEIETEEDFPGEAYIHRLQCLGIRGDKASKLIRSSSRENLEGFDEGSEEYITLTPDDFLRGRAMAGMANMVCVDLDKSKQWAPLGFWKVRCNFRGLIGTKPSKRRIKVNEQIMQIGDGTSSGDIAVDLPGASTDRHRFSISLPKIVVSDCYVSTEPVDTTLIPGNETPPSPPSIASLVITVSEEDAAKLLFHWPNGWKLADIDSERIPGADLYLHTKTWEYVWPATFG